MAAHICNPSTGKLHQESSYEFGVNMGYTGRVHLRKLKIKLVEEKPLECLE